jgi:hypothetical protein
LVDFDNAYELNVESESRRTNTSVWGAGADGRLLNNGNVAISASVNSGSNLRLASGKTEVGVGTVLALTNNDLITVGGSGNARITMTSAVTDISGTGDIVLSGTNAAISGDSNRLINGAKHTIRGNGQTLRLEMPQISITSTWKNAGRVEVMNGANLVFVNRGLESFFSNGDTFSGGGTWAAYADDLQTKIQFDTGSAFGSGITTLDNVELILSGNNAQFYTVSNGVSKALKDTLTTINGNATLALKMAKYLIPQRV